MHHYNLFVHFYFIKTVHSYFIILNQGQLLGAEGTSESTEWLDKNAHKYGFIVRYKPQFVEKTGYMEESWHIRYVGEDVAKTIYEKIFH